MKQQQNEILKAINQLNSAGEIIPEKYDEKVVKNRIIREKVKLMTENLDVHKKDFRSDKFEMDDEFLIVNRTISNIQIFYYIPLKWYKSENHNITELNTVFFPKVTFKIIEMRNFNIIILFSL